MQPAIALRRLLLKAGTPVISEYELFRIWRSVLALESLDGEKIAIRSSSKAQSAWRRQVHTLVKNRHLRPDPDFYGQPEELWNASRPQHYKVFRVSDIPDCPAEDLICLIDPFAYISHLSAMQRYGLTNRSPAELNMTTPAVAEWRELRHHKLALDWPSGKPEGPPLELLVLPDLVRGRRVSRHRTSQTTKTQMIRGTHARIATIGETFVQMLDRPELCGGMRHVIEVWAKEARSHVSAIVEAVDSHTSGIIKVRAGYLLNEVLGIEDSRIGAWEQFAQRGSSRKLDASLPYLATFSERWMLSVNVESEYLPSPAGS
jgi:predicted transcriptional regulator of viral defense system